MQIKLKSEYDEATGIASCNGNQLRQIYASLKLRFTVIINFKPYPPKI